MLGFFSDGKIVLGFYRDVKGNVVAMNILAKIGLSDGFGVDVSAFGDLKLKVSLEDVPFDKLKALSNPNDPLDTLETLTELNKTVSFKGASIHYVDGVLADKVFEQAPPMSQLNGIIRQQLTFFLTAYPAEREQILDAVAGFLKGKNAFLMKLEASTPIPVKDLLNKFTSGQINRDLAVTVIGS